MTRDHGLTAISNLLAGLEAKPAKGAPRTPIRRPCWCAVCLDPIPSGAYCSRCASVLARRDKAEHLARARQQVPEGYRTCRFPSLPHVNPQSAIATAQSNQAALAILIHGPFGSGRTTLAAALFNSALDLAEAEGAKDGPYRFGAFAAWTSASELALARCSYPPDEDCPPVRRAKYASLLVLTDLGSELALGHGSEAPGEVIHSRSYDKRPTVVTTTLGPRDLASRYGHNVMRRLTEPEFGAVAIRLGGAS